MGASNLVDTQDESASFYENSAGEGKDSFGDSTGVNDEETDNKAGDNIDTENDKNETTDDSDGPKINDVKPTDTGENISMTGNYAKPFTVPENNYIISGGSIYLVNSEVAMKTMRAYITLTNSSSARVSIAFDDDDPTAIKTKVSYNIIK